MERQQGAAPYGAALAVIELPAEIDAANACHVDEALTAALLSGASVVIVDMSDTTFCDSSCVRSLARAHHRAAAKDIDLRFAIAGRGVLRILQITGLDGLLRIFPSVEAARVGRPVPEGEAPVRLPGRPRSAKPGPGHQPARRGRRFVRARADGQDGLRSARARCWNPGMSCTFKHS